jgi:hypothetical protein
MRTLIIGVMLGVAATMAGCTGGAAGSSAATTTPSVPGSSAAVPDTAASTPATGSGTGCQTSGWDVDLKESLPQSSAELIAVRAGQHECFDRVVYDIAGSAEVGYHVGYVPLVTADGSGEPVPVAGTAALQVVIRAPAKGIDPPGEPLAMIGESLHPDDQLAGWRSLRAVRYAGSFEGQTTIAVGVSETLPFTVSTQLDDAGRISKVVVDIAHGR